MIFPLVFMYKHKSNKPNSHILLLNHVDVEMEATMLQD